MDVCRLLCIFAFEFRLLGNASGGVDVSYNTLSSDFKMIPPHFRSRCFLNRGNLRERFFSSVPTDQPALQEAVTKSTVYLQGWIKAVRKMKNLLFLNIDDGKSPKYMQVVVPKQLINENISFGASVKVKGELGTDPKGNVEVRAENIEIVGKCDVSDSYPFVPKNVYSEEHVRQFLHLRSRTDSFSALLRIRDASFRAVHNFFHSDGFCLVNTPILTSSDCEGAGEVFAVKPNNPQLIQKQSPASKGNPVEDEFFDKKVYLSVSGQLHLEAAVRNLAKVYTFGPIFRSENSKSRLHLSEFYMVEAEMAFADSLNQVTDVSERLIRSVVQNVLDTCAADINTIGKNQKNVNAEYPEKYMLEPVSPEGIAKIFLRPYVTMTYDEAITILESLDVPWKTRPKRGDGLTKEHELALVKHVDTRPVFVVEWPSHLKAFYMRLQPQDSSKVAAMDLLAPVVGEVCGGSLREDDCKRLENKLIGLNLKDSMEWYLEIRKFGNVPTGGFGLGFERLLQSILSIRNIKDTIPFPRWPHNCQM